jgi:hypothetical protein
MNSGLSVVPQNRQWEDDAGHASRSDGLLWLESGCTMVFQSGLKSGGCAMAGGTSGTITEVASESS